MRVSVLMQLDWDLASTLNEAEIARVWTGATIFLIESTLLDLVFEKLILDCKYDYMVSDSPL